MISFNPLAYQLIYNNYYILKLLFMNCLKNTFIWAIGVPSFMDYIVVEAKLYSAWYISVDCDIHLTKLL